MNVRVTKRLMGAGLHGWTGVWVVVGWVWILAIARGDDWPQYRGSNHDGVSNEKILTDWTASSPRQIWKVPLTDGFSSFAIVSGKAFTLVGFLDGSVAWKKISEMQTYRGSFLWEDNGCWAAW